jgi:predicted GNAT superfamily acetyltransferase
MAVQVTEQDLQELDALIEAARSHPNAASLREQFRPVILDHLRQAHESLGLIVQAYEAHSPVKGSVIYGYSLQHEQHMAAAHELLKQLYTGAIEMMQDGNQ